MVISSFQGEYGQTFRQRESLMPHSIYIRQIFDRNLNKIIRMTRKQIRAFNKNNAVLDIGIRVSTPSTENLDMLANVAQYILFVGGYSGSPYAQGRLSAEFGPRGIEVRTPHEDSYVTQGIVAD